MSATRRQLHLNAFLMEAGHHEAAWRLPHSNPRAAFGLRHWIKLAQLAESAKFDSLFLADGRPSSAPASSVRRASSNH